MRRVFCKRDSLYLVGAPGFEPGTSCAQGRRVIFSKPFLCATSFENKRLAEKFGGGMKYQNVAPHAQSPPNFPHSQRQSQGVSYEEGGEVAGGDNARGFMTNEH